MAISGKEAAREVMEHLPDDATLEDIRYALYVREKIERGLREEEAGNLIDDHADMKREIASWRRDLSTTASRLAEGTLDSTGEPASSDDEPVMYHLERQGWATVLVPDRPVPPITNDMVNSLIEEMRREREDRWLGLTTEDGD